MSLYLNGERTDDRHMIYLEDRQTWRRDQYGQVLFPETWRARLHVVNHSGKGLTVVIGQEKNFFDVPTIADGASFDFDIPLGKTFFLVK